jgi:CBS domain-containing protein
MSTVRNLLEKKGTALWSVDPDVLILEAIELMAEKDIGAVVVLDGDDLVGILSERDCVRRVMLIGKRAKDLRVGSVMTPSVIYVRPEFSLQGCLAVMTDNHIRHLPVLDGKKPIGLITLGDVVKDIISNQENVIQKLENLVAGIDSEP